MDFVPPSSTPATKVAAFMLVATTSSEKAARQEFAKDFFALIQPGRTIEFFVAPRETRRRWNFDTGPSASYTQWTDLNEDLESPRCE